MLQVAVGSPHAIYVTFVTTANRPGPHLITDRWAVSSGPTFPLGLLRLGLDQAICEVMLQLNEIKQIKLDFNNSKYNKKNQKLKLSIYVYSLGSSIDPL